MGAVNHLAVIAAVLAQQALGWLWYSPLLFAGPWANAMHRTAAPLPPVSAPFLISILGSFAFCYTLAWLMQRTGRTRVRYALPLAAALWLGLQFFSVGTQDLFLGYGWDLIAIDSGLLLACALLAALILGLWRHRAA
ncbi:MAG TPA: DUF1761 domain-containing protein [bacterium]|nr:DUF1761 domain-containing protein [bacterium]